METRLGGGENGREWKEMAQIMYTHINKCKNNKKFKK
jgi:hypothetical protein